MVKVGQYNGIYTHRKIRDPINKALEELDLPIIIAASTLIIDELSLVSGPVSVIVKLPMYDGLCVIVPLQDMGSRLIMGEITLLLYGINPALIRISVILVETLVFCHLNNLYIIINSCSG